MTIKRLWHFYNHAAYDSRVASRCERILYLLDGKFRGELALGKFKSEEERVREQKVSDWLGKLGW